MALSQKAIPYKSRYEMVSVDTLLESDGQRIVIDDESNYLQLTVKTNGGGVVPRNDRLVSGKQLKTRKQTRVSAGQFIFSKIDARNGAFGVIPQQLDGAVVTSEFPVFTVYTQRILPEYLALTMASDALTGYIKSLVQGSTNRKRLDIGTFLKIKIPLPSLDKQKELLDAYLDSMCELESREGILQDLSRRIQGEIKTLTGTSIQKNENVKSLTKVTFRNMVNWSVDSLLGDLTISSNYPMKKIGDYVEAFMFDEDGGSLRTAPDKLSNADFLYVGMENIEKGIGRLTFKNLRKGNEIKSSALRVPRGFYLYGRLRPNLNKYWHNEELAGENIICSTEFFVFSIKEDEPDGYFECMLSSDIVQEQVKKHITGTGLPRVNASDFLQMLIPDPPADVKKHLGTIFKENQRKMWEANQFVVSERGKALKTFESKLFEQS